MLQRLGEVPVLLSTPTWVDLRIDPAELVERLSTYVAAGAVAGEADLYLACTRVDLARVTDQVRTALDDLPVPVVLQDGSRASFTAGPALRRYLDDPFREPALRLDQGRGVGVRTARRPPSLAAFPGRSAATTATARPRSRCSPRGATRCAASSSRSTHASG